MPVAEQVFDTFADSPSGVALIARTGRFLRANDALGRMAGRSPSQLARSRWQDVFGGDPTTADQELAVRGRGGTQRYLRCRVRPLDDATLLAHFEDVTAERETRDAAVTVLDVSDRRRGDRARLAALVQAAPDAIITQDRDGRITTWNPGAQRMFGLTAEEAIGRDYRETLIPPEDRARYAALREEIRAGRMLTLRDVRMRADGSRFPAQISAAPLGSGGGALAIVRDISDLEAAEKALEERAAQLERSNADLERFAYSASHDLQEPLRSMKLGAATVIATAADRLDDEERELLEHIESTAARLSAQVRGLMEVAPVALGAWPEELVPVQVALQDAVDALRAAADASAAVIDVHPLPAARVPRAEVSLVMQNLIANAIKYHRRDVAPRITITGSKSDGKLEVRVADNGVGLSEADRSRIFGVFERAQPGVPGTGMGLAVARRMLERHGGSLSAVSAGPGQGSQFMVRLPA
ncbi:sensor histidine kinase [Candidatus Solirubrobacter pratensis]|uniref:sensor histidine kinase n=1 Tax=Candidatus Solirubrobacter pratensis TaxID=1298857 RepID=UPI00210126EB|nr:PAS domain S-box protein [Candidatus Solirubrobacter pratensis]